MGIFDGLSDENLATSTIDPKRLFRALSKPPKSRFQFPHDIQSEVWDQWFGRRGESDLIIKMNTGSGKTVIGLVILKSSLNEGVGPAVYLVPDNQLRTQVQETASELGIMWTSDPYDPGFRQNQSVLITTVHTIYNGRSKFGVRGVDYSSIDIGSIVIDDAHACIPAIERQFTLSVNEGSQSYKEMFDLFSESLKQQSLSGFTEISQGDGSVAVPIPYWDWNRKLETTYKIINNHLDTSQQFVWPLIREQLDLCDAAVSPQCLEIRLPYPDLSVVPSYVGASRRVYMTATLADDSVLTTRMGVESQCVTAPIVPSTASDLGDRLILTPKESRSDPDLAEIKTLVGTWAKNYNVVVVVPSHYRADKWKPYTSEIHNRDSIEDVIHRLKTGHVGLVVLIARYDGVDLPDDACRVLILDGLPAGYSPLERIEASALGETQEMGVRQIQRIEQGMGRGIRSTDDYCVVLLLDPRLVEQLYSMSSQLQLSPATRAQYELSRQFAQTSTSTSIATSLEFFDEAVTAFLDRDEGWVRASKKALENIVYDIPEHVSPVAVAERKAFQLALARRFEEAKEVLLRCADDAVDVRHRGWIKQRAANYIHAVDPEGARKIQQSARIDNSYLLKIPNDSTHRKLKATKDQAISSSNYLKKKYQNAQKLELGIEALLHDLTPIPEHGSSKRFEAAMEQLGLILGYGSSRPEQETGTGPDNFWVTSDNEYWVIEAKSEATADEISRAYLEQLTHSVDWFEKVYPGRNQCIPVLIHPSRFPKADAIPRENARVMTFTKLEELRDNVGRFSRAIQIDNGYRDPAIVEANLITFKLDAKSIRNRWTDTFKNSGSFKRHKIND